MKRTTTLLAVLVMIATLAVPAWAITRGGEPDDGEHPYVGLSVYFDADNNPLWRCSGTLVSPTLYLTAGHCTTAPAATAVIFFQEDVDAVASYPFGDNKTPTGTAYTHPQYDDATFYLHDLGVVVLDKPVRMDTYGTLPELGVLDEYARTKHGEDTLTAVGYGLQEINPVRLQDDRVRLKADLEIVDLNGTAGIPAGTSVMVDGNASDGGTCFGDSGGPMFLEGTTVVAAVTSFGLNGNCAGVGGGYRVDTSDDLEWLHAEFADELSSGDGPGRSGRRGR